MTLFIIRDPVLPKPPGNLQPVIGQTCFVGGNDLFTMEETQLTDFAGDFLSMPWLVEPNELFGPPGSTQVQGSSNFHLHALAHSRHHRAFH